MVNFSAVSNSGLFGRGLRLPLKLVPSSLVIPVLQGRLRGRKWIVGSGTHGCWLGCYEYEKQKLFVQKVGIGDIIYDIGAHVGFYTMLAAECLGPSGKVLAFEPVPRNVAFLKRHISLNGYSNVTVIEAAVSDRSGTASFHMSGDDHSAGHLATSGQFYVQMVTLDELTEEGMPIPDLIKMDIEGGELPALMGAMQLLVTKHPTIFLSTHSADIHRKCCKLLSDVGYMLKPSTGGLSIDQTDEIIAYHTG